ncbi:ureidoglycolate hydrolase [Parasedimentitalea marina]|uniref:Ureidoglycolate hydrolase n=1 Tax=Parasedimentitalea marina TaxID=2483033 RepID=A0A3T0MY87_9RHOB|nr:ureidoglycolate lyase [Parasedimentitalea marina]AZV76728.1 ureidoglycolate hydrolase [Parasedimentitalea marina]
MSEPQYIFEASSKPSLPLHEVPLIRATEQSIEGYGCFVDDPDTFDIEIKQWPAQGWRPIDQGTGDEGGWVEGIFRCDWKGDVLYGENEAVNGEYVLGWSTDPQMAKTEASQTPRNHVLLWHMNYHPDGGQFFYPLENKPFIVPLALPGDNLSPDKVVAFWCDGSRGLYIHPSVWHEGVFPVTDTQRFQDRQGRVHARVSADIGTEFGVYLACPLTTDKIKSL